MSKLTYAQGIDRPVLVDLTADDALGWQDFAACREVGIELFFPAGPAPAAKLVCAGCPVRDECLNYALSFERLGYIPIGIYGGLSGDERDAILVAERARSGEAA